MAAHPRISAYVVSCVRCGRHTSECGVLSARGRCRECAGRAMVENDEQLRHREGPYFERWKQRCLTVLLNS